MTSSPLRTRARAFIVAGIVGGATIAGVATAQAAPDTGSASVITVAGDCQVYWPSTFQVCGAIRDLYNTLGGPAGSLSFPKSAEVTNTDGSKTHAFLNGTIYWSSSTGAYVV